MKKIISLTLLMAMLLSALVGITSYASEASDEPALEVAYANIELANAVYIYFAVDYSDFGSKDGIKLKVTNTVSGVTTTLSPKSNIAAPEGCVAFRYASIGTTNMGDELIVQAYRNGEASGEAKTYSILEYALKAHESGEKKLVDLVESMIRYGASQQKLANHYGTYDLKESWSLVVVSGATVRKTIVKTGSELTLTPADQSKAILYTSALERVESNTIVASEAYQAYQFLGEENISE